MFYFSILNAGKSLELLMRIELTTFPITIGITLLNQLLFYKN